MTSRGLRTCRGSFCAPRAATPDPTPTPEDGRPGEEITYECGALHKREIMQRFALLPWGDENWVPSAGWRVRAGAGWGFAVVRVAVAGAEGAQWWRRAACRHCSRLDRSRP